MEINNKIVMPFVSIIVPVYNGEKIIGGCIESLLAQSYSKDRYEIIVIDNGSIDNTPNVVRAYKNVKLLFETKIKSAYASRNKGISEAKGDLIAFTDDDCIADNKWLEKIVSIFNDPNIGSVGGSIINTSEEGDQISAKIAAVVTYLNQSNTIEHYYLPYIQTANAVYRKEVFAKIGIFCLDDTKYSGGDADICWRMQLNTDLKVFYCKDAIVFHKDKIHFWKFINKFHRYGVGQIALSRKYNFECKLYPLIRYSEINNILIFIRRLIVSPIKRKGMVHVLTPLFLVLLHIANEKGKRYALKQMAAK